MDPARNFGSKNGRMRSGILNSFNFAANLFGQIQTLISEAKKKSLAASRSEPVFLSVGFLLRRGCMVALSSSCRFIFEFSDGRCVVDRIFYPYPWNILVSLSHLPLAAHKNTIDASLH